MMKHLLSALAFLALASLAGCGSSGSSGGVAPDKENFSLTLPTLSTKLKQGEAKTVSISISRGKNFDQDVSLKFGTLPQGVTLDPAAPVLKHSDTKVDVTVKAADDAAVGDFTIKVFGQPAKGKEATNELKITVEKK